MSTGRCCQASLRQSRHPAPVSNLSVFALALGSFRLGPRQQKWNTHSISHPQSQSAQGFVYENSLSLSRQRLATIQPTAAGPLTHSLTHSLSHSLTLSLSHSHSHSHSLSLSRALRLKFKKNVESWMSTSQLSTAIREQDSFAWSEVPFLPLYGNTSLLVQT